jgi:ribosomal protein S18 acetylase RimI-like enzyme
VVALHGRLYAAEYGLDVGMEAVVAGGLAEWLRSDGELPGALWVADAAGDAGPGRIAGSIGVTGLTREEARLRWFCVDPASRGRGLGGALLDGALRFAREAGYGRIALETFAELTGAARLYRSAGFRVVSEERGLFCGREVDMQWYALEL